MDTAQDVPRQAPARVADVVVGLDGDDTLWHSESIFTTTHERFHAMVGRYATDAAVDEHLLATEQRNLSLFGYGVKGFTLSLIETAIEVTAGRIGAEDIATIIGWGREMLAHPVDLIDGAGETVARLARRHRLVLVTKGDLFHQESKIARSGLARYFDHIEILSEKDPAAYRTVLDRCGIAPASFVMVGNSVRSDVLPVLDVGGRAVHIPYRVTWAHEEVADDEHADRPYVRLADIRDLPGLLAH